MSSKHTPKPPDMIDWELLKNDFLKECVTQPEGVMSAHINRLPEDIIEWLKNKLTGKIAYVSQDKAMELLGCGESKLHYIAKRGLLSKWNYIRGATNYYSLRELEQYIEATEMRERSKKALEEYSDSTLLKHDKVFALSHMKRTLFFFEEFKLHWGSDREEQVVTNIVMGRLSFSDMAEQYDISRERVRQIYVKSMRRLNRKLVNMKRDYDRNYLAVWEENKKLKEENAFLQNAFEKLSVEQKKQYRQIIEGGVHNDVLLSSLDISPRTLNCLNSVDLKYVGDLIENWTRSDLMKIRNFGKKTLDDLLYGLRAYHLELR